MYKYLSCHEVIIRQSYHHVHFVVKFIIRKPGQGGPHSTRRPPQKAAAAAAAAALAAAAAAAPELALALELAPAPTPAAVVFCFFFARAIDATDRLL